MNAFRKSWRRAVLPAVLPALLAGILVCTESPTESEDTEAPSISLNSTIDTISPGESVPPASVTCVDDTDGDISESVTVEGVVDSLSPGSYTITYTATDVAGNKAVAERTIVVLYPASLFARYFFDGDARDQSGLGHHGTVSGALLCADRFGKEESAYRFDGADDNIIADPLSDFPSGDVPKTVMGWFKSTGAAELQTLFGIGTAQNGKNFQIAKGPEGKFPGQGDTLMRVSGWGDSYDWRTSVQAAELFDGRWHHVAAAYDSARTRFYVDGELRDSLSGGTYLTDPATARIVIGVEADGDGWAFEGVLDDIMVFTTALPADHIGGLYRMGGWDPSAPGDTASPADTSTPSDTTSSPGDTTTPSDPPPATAAVTGLTHTIQGTAGSLTLELSWDAVPGAFGYGVYWDQGTTVDEMGYYRIAMDNSRTFTSELTEGETYTFAVTVSDGSGNQSALSEPYTVTFEAP